MKQRLNGDVRDRKTVLVVLFLSRVVFRLRGPLISYEEVLSLELPLASAAEPIEVSFPLEVIENLQEDFPTSLSEDKETTQPAEIEGKGDPGMCGDLRHTDSVYKLIKVSRVRVLADSVGRGHH